MVIFIDSSGTQMCGPKAYALAETFGILHNAACGLYIYGLQPVNSACRGDGR